jgi:hypothetical protein
LAHFSRTAWYGPSRAQNQPPLRRRIREMRRCARGSASRAFGCCSDGKAGRLTRSACDGSIASRVCSCTCGSDAASTSRCTAGQRQYRPEPRSAGASTSSPDQLADGRRFRALTVIDLLTHECLALDIGQSQRPRCRRPPGASAIRARAAAADLLRQRYCIVSTTMDLRAYTNASSSISAAAASRPTTPPSNPSKAASGKCLNGRWYASLEDAKVKIDAFRWDYNEHHPPMSQGPEPSGIRGEDARNGRGLTVVVVQKSRTPHVSAILQ